MLISRAYLHGVLDWLLMFSSIIFAFFDFVDFGIDFGTFWEIAFLAYFISALDFVFFSIEIPLFV